MRFLTTVLAFASFIHSLSAADKLLADAAKPLAAKLKTGCIVTGERIGDATRFAITGSPPPLDGAPCEKLAFEIGSITKVFTSLLLAQAVVEKKVTLQTPISALLDTEQTFADPSVAAITLEQLATHTSGLPRLPANAFAGAIEGDPYAHYDEALLRSYLEMAKLKGKPPFPCSYSNLGAGLLGMLLAKVYELPWEEAVAAKVSRPLGLTNTQANKPANGLPLAPPYSDGKEVKPWTFQAMAGAGALRSTTEDLVRLGEAIIDPSRTPLADAFEIALKPHAEAPAYGGHIGLGIFIRDRDGVRIYHHDGGTGGYRSGIQVIPSRKIVRVALINNDTVAGSEVIAATEPQKPMPAVDQQPSEINLSPDALQRYAGIYVIDADSQFTILVSDGRLWVRLTGQPFLQIFAKSSQRFFYKDVAAELEFHSEADQIQSLTLFQNGNEITAQRTTDAVPAITLRKPDELKLYVGTYAVMGLQDLTISMHGSTLFAQMAGQQAAPVFETAKDKFEFDVVDAALVFTRDEHQAINGLVLQQHGMNIPAARKAK